ncbi:MAG: hypothetical protein M3162_06700, partial [Thermoproteota archaeon]|nr:hypothetical protein [Thermoproteota archaeon]
MTIFSTATNISFAQEQNQSQNQNQPLINQLGFGNVTEVESLTGLNEQFLTGGQETSSSVSTMGGVANESQTTDGGQQQQNQTQGQQQQN